MNRPTLFAVMIAIMFATLSPLRASAQTVRNDNCPTRNQLSDLMKPVADFGGCVEIDKPVEIAKDETMIRPLIGTHLIVETVLPTFTFVGWYELRRFPEGTKFERYTGHGRIQTIDCGYDPFGRKFDQEIASRAVGTEQLEVTFRPEPSGIIPIYPNGSIYTGNATSSCPQTIDGNGRKTPLDPKSIKRLALVIYRDAKCGPLVTLVRAPVRFRVDPNLLDIRVLDDCEASALVEVARELQDGGRWGEPEEVAYGHNLFVPIGMNE